jgi:hypothetical protein
MNGSFMVSVVLALAPAVAGPTLSPELTLRSLHPGHHSCCWATVCCCTDPQHRVGPAAAIPVPRAAMRAWPRRPGPSVRVARMRKRRPVPSHQSRDLLRSGCHRWPSRRSRAIPPRRFPHPAKAAQKHKRDLCPVRCDWRESCPVLASAAVVAIIEDHAEHVAAAAAASFSVSVVCVSTAEVAARPFLRAKVGGVCVPPMLTPIVGRKSGAVASAACACRQRVEPLKLWV